MTENIASNPTPDPMENSHPDQINPLPHGSLPSQSAATSGDWETVTFPGQIPINGDSFASPDTVPPAMASEPESGLVGQQRDSTNELLQLVQDLNQCNDVLLARVSELEEALEKSQAALQAEVERNQSGGAASDVAPEQQQEYVQKQVAQLLSELEIANDGLRRTTIHNDTLQTELEASQQRVAQLERECTLLQQRFSEKNTALQRAEDTCRDLKARLHRQQRYTLQFKAALEKCLNMSTEQQTKTAGLTAAAEPSVGPAPAHPLSMPKTPQIQPWSVDGKLAKHDASLEHLLRSLKPAIQEPKGIGGTDSTASSPMSSAETTAETGKSIDPEAEALLWEDLARVMAPPAEVNPSEANPGSEAAFPPAEQPTPPEAVSPAPEEHNSLAFTEPSPWGAPLSNSTAAEAEPTTAVGGQSEEVTPPRPAAEPVVPAQSDQLSAFVDPQHQEEPVELPPHLKTTTPQPSPSPVVYPLRPQKRIKSLSAVQLPSFSKSARQG